jgi:glutamyl-tRNA synthetase
MTVVTRFAPSPTGYLHVGSARTALFNWLFARHHGGKFLLRIEDTDRARSTQPAIDAIIEGMKWLGLIWDDDIVFQFSRADRHKAYAEQLLKEGKAYYCYCSPEELEAMRELARAEGRPPRYDGRWRDKDPSEAPAGVKPVIRLKTPQEGATTLIDHVQGEVTVQNNQFDDLILLRADGTPTYMLSVVVDDHEMGISHIIRGDDHFTNSFRQKHLYQALGWDMPDLTHIPLIHGPDGAKLSKRHGALGIEAYRDMGILPEAMCNYLLRLGWSHGDDEIIPLNKAIEWFTLDSIGKSPARFDLVKLMNLNGHYIRERSTEQLCPLIVPLLAKIIGRDLKEHEQHRIAAGMTGLKERAKDLNELANLAWIYTDTIPYPFAPEAEKHLTDEALTLLQDLLPVLEGQEQWQEAALEITLRAFADRKDLKFGKVAQPLRAALTGRPISPGLFEIMAVLGKQETLNRLNYIAQLT